MSVDHRHASPVHGVNNVGDKGHSRQLTSDLVQLSALIAPHWVFFGFRPTSALLDSTGHGMILILCCWRRKGKEMFYLTTHSTLIYGHMASYIWRRTTQIVRDETRCRHMGYSFRLTARVILYAPSHRLDSTYHDIVYTSRGALAGTGNSSMGPSHEGSTRRLIAPWANALTMELHLAPTIDRVSAGESPWWLWQCRRGNCPAGPCDDGDCQNKV